MAKTRNIVEESERIPAIEDAVDAMHGRELGIWNDDGTREEFEVGEWYSYEVMKVDEPADNTSFRHRIYFSDVPDDHETRLMAWVFSELAERGFVINAVDLEGEFFHVMHRNWIDRRLTDGDSEHRVDRPIE